MRTKKSKNKGVALWNKAKKLIPGGSQLLSKRSEMFLPEQWPSYYSRAKGIDVVGLDSRRYCDFSIMGVGACALGYADPDVNAAVRAAISRGSMATLNCPEEVELAELLCALHPWAQMARFARTGGEAMAVAVRIARAYSGKDRVAFCGYHGWHDWYLAANLGNMKQLDGHLLPGLLPRGVPRSLLGTALTFPYNDITSLEELLRTHRDIGAIVVETMRHEEPKNDFLKRVRRIATRAGAALIFDEITIGWRLALGGAHLLYGAHPDIAVFAKAMSNGFPCAAVIGKREVMQAAQSSFVSSTYWTERIGPVAALAAIKKMKQVDLPAHLKKIGKMIGEGWERLAEKHCLHISVQGPPALVTLAFLYGSETQALRTLFTQEMLSRGYLAGGSVYVSYAHHARHVATYLRAVDAVFGMLAQALCRGTVRSLLRGPVAHSGFKRLT